MQASPSPAGSMFFFYTNYLGFRPEFVGRIQLLDGVAQLLGEQLTTSIGRWLQPGKKYSNVSMARPHKTHIHCPVATQKQDNEP